MVTIPRYLCLALAGFSLAAGPLRAAVSDPNFTETLYYNNAISNFAATGMAWAPDGSGRLFVLRKGGFNGTGTAEVRIVQSGTILPTAFASETVFTSSECGLIGMAFDPGFATNGYVYFLLTVSSTEQQIIRYTASGNVGIDRTLIIPGLPTRGANHDGGGLGIGRDGKLYWAVGDLGNRTGVDLNTTTLAAKAGRANRDGTVPTDNPFFDGSGPNNDYIFAGGLRNPYTMTFQPGTGALWINVVGDGYEQVMVVGRGDNGGYDNVENGIPSGSPAPYARYITPVIKYRTNGTDSRTISAGGAVRAGNVVTISTTAAHGFRAGEKITIAGVSNASFNGTFFLSSIPTATTFTYAQVGPDASSGSPASPAATAVTLNIGGSITGGTFLDTTSVPATYRGNYFFGDYNSGRVIRSTLDASNAVTSVDEFATTSQAIDLAVGPDGALYGLQINGNIRRWAYTPSAQALIVTPTQLQTDEGARIAFTVRLATAPANTLSVSIQRTAGDSDLSVQSGSSLAFTAANWSTPQTVMIQAVEDADATDDTADFSVSATGLSTETVRVFALDNDAPTIVISSAALTVTEGSSNTFNVRLTGPPSSPVTLTAARTSGDPDLFVSSGTSLSFNSTNFSTAQTVVVTSAEDADAGNGSASITISGTGFVSQTVTATESDNDAIAPVITSSPPTTAVINAPFAFDVNASGNPPPAFSLTSAPNGMVISSETGIINWTPTALGSFNGTVQASNGALPAALQNFTISVVADQPPVASLTRPYEGEFVTGTGAEFFGDGSDDVGTVRGEFYIDGQLRYTDNTVGGHYHIGGTHNQWDTTQLSNGAHVVRLTVFDSAGQSASVERNVIVANGVSRWEAWKLAKFSAADLEDPAVSGGSADYDGDSLSTLLEYAFGGNPKIPDAVEPILGRDGDHLTITFTVVLGADDLNYGVEGSSDLTGGWDSSGFTLVNTESLGAVERLTFRDGLALTPETKRFLRVRVIRSSP